jgi:diadenosine tetraphosphate (Ap4A) HIT family hydrolase
MSDLHPQLKSDCLVIGRFPLSQLLLMRDANYPWFILVPDRPDISEIHQLSEGDQLQLIRESSLLAVRLMEAFQGDKMNIAALGNVVPQLHIHHVVRYRHDAAWPAPVWGKLAARPYSEAALEAVVERVKAVLKDETGFTFL